MGALNNYYEIKGSEYVIQIILHHDIIKLLKFEFANQCTCLQLVKITFQFRIQIN